MTHRIVRKNVGRIAKMSVMDSTGYWRENLSRLNYVSWPLQNARIIIRKHRPRFEIFPDVKEHFSIYFISRAHHMSIILTPLPTYLPVSFLCPLSCKRIFFTRPNFVDVNFFMQRNNNRHIFKLDRQECQCGFLHAAPFILFKIYPRVLVCIFQ